MQANYYPTTATPQRVPLGFDMNHLYLSPSQQQTSRPGVFLKRNERIDWRRIAAVDVDCITRDMDFQVLQDNLEQITLCNIDAEVDSRSMDPNFLKLYKIAQLTIEYLLVCQDQISTHLIDTEQYKNKDFDEQKNYLQEIKKLKDDLFEAKKESKKRRKMLETQQRMLMAQNSNYHTCPVCTHAFLSVSYLQAHMHRRHPDYDPSRRREHDVDIEKETQRLKDELKRKDTELQLITGQKTLADDRVRERDANISQLREEIRNLTTQKTISDDRFFHMTSNVPTQSSHRNETGTSELIKENKNLRDTIEKLNQSLEQAEKLRQRFEKENGKLRTEISNLQENIRLLQSTSGGNDRSLVFQDQYNKERKHREKLESELEEAKRLLGQDREHQPPPPVVDRKAPVLPAHHNEPTVQTRPVRPRQTAEIYLPEYCPKLIQRLKENPKYLAKYRDEAKKQFIEDLEEQDTLGIFETDTRLTDLDFRTKMESVLHTRRNIQQDLPEFERIRTNINRTLDKLTNERLDVRRSITSIRSTGSKLVTFEDERQRQKQPASIYDNTKRSSPDQRYIPTTSTVQTKPKYDPRRPTTHNDSDEDITISNASESEDNTQPTRPGIQTDIQPSPRKNPPPSKTTSGINALVTANIRPSTTSGGTTISHIAQQPLVKPTSTTKKFNSDSESESESPVPPPSTHGAYSSNASDKKRIIEQKLREASTKGQKPGINAIVQGIQPSRQSLASHNDDDESESLTTLHTNPPPKTSNGHLPQLSGRESVNNNPLSSGDGTQHTYDSLWKSPAGKGAEFRRPATADSAKTSNMGSDDSLDGEESN